MNLDDYNPENYTHTFRCKHAIGKTLLHYEMKCTLVSTTKSGNARIVVFGDRYWANSQSKRVRYINKYRLQERKELKNARD